MKLLYAGATHVGMKRDHNEDNFMLMPVQNLFAVADGMGGHASGEVASQIAVESVRQFFEDTFSDEDITWPFKLDKQMGYLENRVATSVKLANKNIFESALADPRRKGMGTTFVGFVATQDSVVIGHVGDSRCYRVRDGGIEQLTEDHSLLNDYKKIQKLTPEEEANFPHKNIIVRALGMKDSVEVDVSSHATEEGDILVLCSDGLNGEVEDDDILQSVLEHESDLDSGVEALIEGACQNGGKDNVTVILVKYVGS
jgi:protein phosphatase